MTLTKNQSFNDAELTKGFHLLTESSHSVKVKNTIPESSAHLYPRLAGSNWTCYISQNKVVLGRSTEKTKVDVDFGSSKAISRKHCEIRFSHSRRRWELVVFGGMGVKINHVLKKRKDRPTVLTTGSLIDINSTSFVFIEPPNAFKPYKPPLPPPSSSTTSSSSRHRPQPHNEPQSESEANTPAEEIRLDNQLEALLIDLFEKRERKMTTQEIVSTLNENRSKPIEKGTLLHVMVMSSRFELENDSINLSANESDAVQWKLIEPKVVRDMSLVETPSLEPASLGGEEEEEWSIMDNSARQGSVDLDIDVGDEEEEDDDEDEDEDPPPTPHVTISRGLSIESMYTMWNKSYHESNKRKLSDRDDNDNREEEDDDDDGVVEEEDAVDIYKRIRTALLKPNSVLS